jgi:hypothetical protein
LTDVLTRFDLALEDDLLARCDLDDNDDDGAGELVDPNPVVLMVGAN